MPDTKSIFCPRCGYDLGGIRTPDAANGTCSECGLTFSWAELDSGRMHHPTFSIEHGAGLRPIPFLRTVGRSITGWRLWIPLKMEHEIRVGRLLLFAALLVCTIHIAAVVTVVFAAWSPHVYLNGWQPSSWYQITPIGGGAPQIVAPKGAIVLWNDRGRPVTLGDIAPLLQWPYGYTITSAVSGFRIAVIGPDVLAGCAAPMLGTPLVFLMLRQTRRRFKLRKLHLVRGLCLSGPAAITTAIIAMLIASEGSRLVSWPWNTPNSPVVVTAAMACFVYQTLWWWTFARFYLKAPHALGIAVCGVIIGGLVFAFVSFTLDSRLLYGLIA